MTTVNPTPSSLPAALAEPTVDVRPSWVALLFGANLGIWMAFFTPIQVLLPQQLELIDAAHKEANLAWVTAFGALAAVVVSPLAGALSDRTSLRPAGRPLGRRHIWTVTGALLGAASLMVLAQQQTVLGVALGWFAAQSFFNAMLASLTSAVPDRVPVAQRAAVSGWVGIPQALGLVLGAVLTTVLVTGVSAGYVAVALAVLLLGLPFALLTADEPLLPEHRPAARLGATVRALWVSPRRHPDFAWAWGTRFLVQLGNALGTLYLYYFLKDKIRHPDPKAALLVLILLYTAGIAATAVVAGRLSDRSGRRKVYVVWSGVVIALAAALLAVWPVWTSAVAAALLLGAGYGIYLAVDVALITQVLPGAADRAKDLGVINIANSAPQVLGPAMSGPIVGVLGGYGTLYTVTAVVTLLGSVLVMKIRSVR